MSDQNSNPENPAMDQGQPMQQTQPAQDQQHTSQPSLDPNMTQASQPSTEQEPPPVQEPVPQATQPEPEPQPAQQPVQQDQQPAPEPVPEPGNDQGEQVPDDGAMVPVNANGDGNLPAQKLTGFTALDDLAPDLLAELIRENLPDDGISPRDLAKITVPSQGRVTWTYESGGEEMNSRSLEGAIVHTQTQRAYWEKSPEESGSFAPPDCSSTDGLTGVGNPGGSCRTCPLNQFGASGGKPCRETRLVYFLPKDRRMPTVIQAPPTSIPNVRRYLTHLTTDEFVHQWAVMTSLTLEKVEGGNFPYSRIRATMLERLPSDTAAKMEEYVKSIKPFLTQAARREEINQADYIDPATQAPPGETPALTGETQQ